MERRRQAATNKTATANAPQELCQRAEAGNERALRYGLAARTNVLRSGGTQSAGVWLGCGAGHLVHLALNLLTGVQIPDAGGRGGWRDRTARSRRKRPRCNGRRGAVTVARRGFGMVGAKWNLAEGPPRTRRAQRRPASRNCRATLQYDLLAAAAATHRISLGVQVLCRARRLQRVVGRAGEGAASAHPRTAGSQREAADRATRSEPGGRHT